ncbi:SchA/CurD-like domain-containing protein [Streptomyces alkaliterrae]|uniref:WhiE I n=1 Tax=Streptomyces alkaliterrae TaxID=2213162 RepID=A0A5P0YNW7_9ACTN|nr:SchA/CurD-like domain-containing protein [Streptomyces alkaliterrae]MBB1253386.1 WhiE I [Streptomyces alkaliterrae]MBB1259180.1 WhiE I [Streptomyces alkaliterrae]MQS01590.1 WhiE I [Streptomyces alkaliterrae]
MQRYAITFRVKPGSEEAVRRLLTDYPPPEPRAADGTRLLGTSVFMKGDVVVRMLEIEGELASAMAHLATQPAVRELERRLDPHLLEPRDMSSREGARSFFQRALMTHLTTRVAAASSTEKVEP